MKSTLFFTTVFVIMTISSFAQQKTWDRWAPLIGEWVGEGSGQPGQGGGTFTFSLELDKKVIMRKSHSEYLSKDNNKTKVTHDDLMVVYMDGQTNLPKAIYFDNDGHTITYDITYGDNSITLTGERILSSPVFRLTYTITGKDEMNTKFEMSPDGQKFMTHIEGKCHRAK